MPANKVLECQKGGGGKAWAYSFAWKIPLLQRQTRCGHSVDFPFVFKDSHKDSQRIKKSSGPIFRIRWQKPCSKHG